MSAGKKKFTSAGRRQKKILTGLVLMRNVTFWDFLSRGTTANSDLYISTLRSLNARLRP